MRILFVDDIPKQRTKKQLKQHEKTMKKFLKSYKQRKDDNTKISIFSFNMNCEEINDAITQLELEKGEIYSQQLLNKLNEGEG